MEGMGSTLIIDLSRTPAEFGLDRIMMYITTDLELNREQLERVHYRTSTKTVFVDVKDPSVAIRVLSDRGPAHAMKSNGDAYGIPITLSDGSTIVKLHDLSPDIMDCEIVQFMESFGTVIRILEGEWTTNTPLAGLPNGYRYVQMMLNEIVPEIITIGGERTLATHHGQYPLWRNDLPRPPSRADTLSMEIYVNSPSQLPCAVNTSRIITASVKTPVPSSASAQDFSTPTPTSFGSFGWEIYNPDLSTSTSNSYESLPSASMQPTTQTNTKPKKKRLQKLKKNAKKLMLEVLMAFL